MEFSDANSSKACKEKWEIEIMKKKKKMTINSESKK
jgi:hypothetical protein